MCRTVDIISHFPLFNFTGPIVKFLTAVVTTTIVANACHYCILQVYSTNNFSINTFNSDSLHLQKAELIKNIEKLSFWVGDNRKLNYAKQELLSQIKNLDISISGKGFFTVNRGFMGSVRLAYWFERHISISTIFIYFLSQVAAAYCAYIIIFIQFYLYLWN